MAKFLAQLYNRDIDMNDAVTVIHFSEIVNPGFSTFHPRLTPACGSVMPPWSAGAQRRAALLALDREHRSRCGRRTKGSGCSISPPHCGHSAATSASLLEP